MSDIEVSSISKSMSKLFRKDMFGLGAFMVGLVLILAFILSQLIPLNTARVDAFIELIFGIAGICMAGGFFWVIHHCVTTYGYTYSHDAVWKKAIHAQKNA